VIKQIPIPIVTALLLAIAVIVTSADVDPVAIQDKERSKMAGDYLKEIKSLSPKTDPRQFVEKKVMPRLTPKAANQASMDLSPVVDIPPSLPPSIAAEVNLKVEALIQQFLLTKISAQEFINQAELFEADLQRTSGESSEILLKLRQHMARAYKDTGDKVNEKKKNEQVVASIGGLSKKPDWMTDDEWEEVIRIWNTRTLITVYSNPENCDVEAAGYAYVNTTPVTFQQTIFGKTYGELRVSKPGYYTRTAKVVMKEGVDNQFTFKLPKTNFWGYFALTVLSAGAGYGFGAIAAQGNLSTMPASQQGFEQYAGAFGIGLGESLSITGFVWGIWGMIDGHGGGLINAVGKPIPQKE
jgi:hypothetical protein